MQELIAHENNYVLKCQFSLDSKFLATCSSDKTCVVWELATATNQPDPGAGGAEGEDEMDEENEEGDFEEYV